MTNNEQVALWLGYKFDATRPDDLQWESPTGEMNGDAPMFDHYYNLWPAIYREIERRGLCKRFLDHLVGYRELHTEVDLAWFILVATPAERLAAMEKVIEEDNHG